MHARRVYMSGITHVFIGRPIMAIWPKPTRRSGMKKVTQTVEYTWLAQSYMYLGMRRRAQPRRQLGARSGAGFCRSLRGRRARASHHAHRSGCDQSLRARWKNVSFLREASPAGAPPRSPALSLSFVSSLSFSSALSSAPACIWCPRICLSLRPEGIYNTNIEYQLVLRLCMKRLVN